MAESLNEHESRKYLAAFADGELDVEQNLRVLEHMAINPTATRRVMHQQQLRQAVDRTIRNETPATPEVLKQQIQKLMADTPATGQATVRDETGRAQGASVLARIGRWAPLAAAAMFFIAALAVLNTPQEHDSSTSTSTSSPIVWNPVSKSHYGVFVKRHLGCSRMIDKLMHTELFPQDLKALPPSLATFLGEQATPGLDLSGIGYEFYAVGKCPVPGEQSVHLIYHAKGDPTGHDALSLWMRRYRGSPAIEPDQAYYVEADEANPLVIWRQGGMIYYLMGNSLANTDRAAQKLRLVG